MHLSHIPQCTIQNWIVHISVLNDALWDMGLVHGGICVFGLLWLLTNAWGGSEYFFIWFYLICYHSYTISYFSIFFIFIQFHFSHFIYYFIHIVICIFIFDILLTMNWFVIAIFSTILFHLSSIFDIPLIKFNFPIWSIIPFIVFISSSVYPGAFHCDVFSKDDQC